MKKILTALALMSLSTGAALASDATDFIKESNVKSNVTRAEVLVKVTDAPVTRSGDATVHVPEVTGSTIKTRAEVLSSMKSLRYAGGGDATESNAWVRR